MQTKDCKETSQSLENVEDWKTELLKLQEEVTALKAESSQILCQVMK